MDKYIITKNQATKLYETMKFLHDTFVKNKITYFMVGGTLLGSVRHQGIIPWDDDGDICILKKDVPKLRKLVKFFKKNGYDLEESKGDDEEDKKNSDCRRKKNSCTWFLSCEQNNCLGIDIFVMYTKGDKITYADPYWETASNGGGRCYFTKELLFPLLPMRFGNFYMFGPHNPIEHLNRCYGENWNTKGQVLFDHRSGKWKNTKPRKLTINEFQTFKAPKSTCDQNIPKIDCNAEKRFFKKK